MLGKSLSDFTGLFIPSHIGTSCERRRDIKDELDNSTKWRYRCSFTESFPCIQYDCIY